MLSIGIDVSKGKSTVCGMKPGGEIVYAPFEVQHTREGMLELVSLLRGSGEEVRVVLESTGSYHCPVVAALLENGIFVSVVNSLRMKRFCSQSIRKVKTDRIDAIVLAVVLMAGITFGTLYAVRNGIFQNEENYETYEFHGSTQILYQDELPLRVEDKYSAKIAPTIP